MWKILAIILMSLIFISQSYAEELKKVDKNFLSSCYKYYAEIPGKNFQENETFFLQWDFKNPIITQSQYFSRVQLFDTVETQFNYTSENISEINTLLDENPNTFIEIDTSKTSEIILDFWEFISEKSIQMQFNFDAKYHDFQISLSSDNQEFIDVDMRDIWDYSFKYIRLKIFKDVKTTNNEKIKISQLSFIKKSYEYLVENNWDDIMKIYTQNTCVENNIIPKYTSKLSSSTQTKKINIYYEENPFLVENPESDSDWDGVLDKADNCTLIFNPKQNDANSNGVWDLCADDDADGIYGNKDNCINIYNPKQTDINRNNIWDKCEFDADSDGVFDSFDNCRNIANADQKDTDKDTIWDACDNCTLYNPNQRDTNQNNIWDVCDQANKNLQENDDDRDEIINNLDNCRYISNKNQLDSDNDGIWDACDNCKNFQNSRQIDLNQNWIWDKCEDSDTDGIEWYLDNCINNYNPDQKDDNNNGVWNVCEDDDNDGIIAANDNCAFKYNRDQNDIDKDGIWDVCDTKDDRFLESNKTIFIALFVLLIAIFWAWIYSVMKKIK